jgi:hypothetical protein
MVALGDHVIACVQIKFLAFLGTVGRFSVFQEMHETATETNQ